MSKASTGKDNWRQYAREGNASQYNWGQYAPSSPVPADQNQWRQYVPASGSQYVPVSNASPEQYDPQYANQENTSGGQEVDWHQSANLENTSGTQDWQLLELSNFSGDASDATTEDELNVWRERARTRINSFTPTAYQSGSLARVDSEYQRNLNRIDAPAVVTTEAPAVAVVVTEVRAVAVVPTQASAVATEAAAVTMTQAPAVGTEAAVVTTTTRTTTWWLFAVSAAEVPAVAPAVSPLRQASPMLLMFALLAGVAVFAVAVGRRQRRNGASSEPLLPAEYTDVP